MFDRLSSWWMNQSAIDAAAREYKEYVRLRDGENQALHAQLNTLREISQDHLRLSADLRKLRATILEIFPGAFDNLAKDMSVIDVAVRTLRELTGRETISETSEPASEAKANEEP
jgi:hypothetical protein